MYISDIDIKFTAEDKTNLIIHRRSREEVKLQKQYYMKRKVLLQVFFMILAIATYMLMGKASDNIWFIFMLLCVMSIFGLIVMEWWYLWNKKLLTSPNYLEIEVVERLSIENVTYSTDFNVAHYYPVIGKDTTTKYQSKIYLPKRDYDNVETGTILKVNITDAMLLNKL
ncbi:MAG: hypothetical protein IKP66_03870 [Lachnospiraceae bacterium]|nr:hypothetical protein [Lachnospiraceae bacterium]